jgi:transposase
MEKGFLEDCLAKGMSLEAIGERAGKHPSTVSHWLKKYGLEARGSARHSPKGNVDVERLRALVEQGASIRGIGEELRVGYSTVRYWLKRLNLETERSVRRKTGNAAREAGLRKAYLRCSKCNTAAVSERRRQVKRKLVEEAGGKYRLCGFDEHPAALQFHHRDWATKEFHLSHGGMTRGIGRMRAEARKCVLLCANCHALVEAGVRNVSVDDR